MPARRRSARAREPAGLRLQPAGRHAADHVGQVRGRRQVAAHRSLQRRTLVVPLRHRGEEDRLRRPRHRRRAARTVRLGDRRRRGPPRTGRRPVGRDCRRPRREQLRERFGPDWAFAVIGPAGENLVRFATISHDNRHAGRGGLGAVLGAKNLKAVGVRGTHRTPTRRPGRRRRGGQGPVGALVRPGDGEVPRTRHRRQPAHLQPPQRAADAQLPGRAVRGRGGHLRRDAQRRAPRDARRLRGLHHRLRAHLSGVGRQNRRQGTGDRDGVRLEYETLFALGPLCGIADRDAILRAARRCDELGLDTISAGATIAFAMECSERGLDPGPPALRQRRHRPVAARSDRPSQGSRSSAGRRHAARGRGHRRRRVRTSPRTSRDWNLPGYEPRALQTMALGFAVGTRGADHNRSGAYEADFSAGRRPTARRRPLRAPGGRDRGPRGPDRLAHPVQVPPRRLRRHLDRERGTAREGHRLGRDGRGTARGRRGASSRPRKLFNIREGWTPAEDTLPRRFLTTALPAGTAPGATLTEERLRDMIAAYNTRRGWSADGWVPETLANLS